MTTKYQSQWTNQHRIAFLKEVATSAKPIKTIAELMGIPECTARAWALEAGIDTSGRQPQIKNYGIRKKQERKTEPNEIQLLLNKWR